MRTMKKVSASFKKVSGARRTRSEEPRPLEVEQLEGYSTATDVSSSEGSVSTIKQTPGHNEMATNTNPKKGGVPPPIEADVVVKEPEDDQASVSTVFDPRLVKVHVRGESEEQDTTMNLLREGVDLNELKGAVKSMTLDGTKADKMSEAAKQAVQDNLTRDRYLSDITSAHNVLRKMFERMLREQHIQRTMKFPELTGLKNDILWQKSNVDKLKNSYRNFVKSREGEERAEMSVNILNEELNHNDERWKEQMRNLTSWIDSVEWSPSGSAKSEDDIKADPDWLPPKKARKPSTSEDSEESSSDEDEDTTDDSTSDDSSSDESSSKSEAKAKRKKKKRKEEKKKEKAKKKKKKKKLKKRKESEKEKRPELRLKPSEFPVLRDSPETKGYNARIFLGTFRSLLDQYKFSFYTAITTLANKVENKKLKDKISSVPPTQDGLETAYQYIVDHYGATDRNISLQFGGDLMDVTKIADLNDIIQAIDALERCQSDESFQYTFEKVDSREYWHLYDAIKGSMKAEWENSPYKASLEGLLTWLKTKKEKLQRRKQVEDNLSGDKNSHSTKTRSSKPRTSFQPSKIQTHATSVVQENKPEEKKQHQPNQTPQATSSKQNTNGQRKMCYICKKEGHKATRVESHFTEECNRLKDKDPKGRHDFVKGLGICLTCLKIHPRDCYKKDKPCDKCGNTGHCPLLCFAKKQDNKEENKSDSKGQSKLHLYATKQDASSTGKLLMAPARGAWNLQCIVGSASPGGKERIANVMFDNANEMTSASREIAEEIGAKAIATQDVIMKTTNAESLHKDVDIVPIYLKNLNGSFITHHFNVWAMPKEVIPQVEVVSNERIAEDYPEIKNVPVYDVKEGTIDICLGQNHEQFCEILERLNKDQQNGPKVARMPLGVAVSWPKHLIRKYTGQESDSDTEEVCVNRVGFLTRRPPKVTVKKVVDECSGNECEKVISENKSDSETLSEALVKDFYQKSEREELEHLTQDQMTALEMKKVVDADDPEIKKPPMSNEEEQVLKETEENAIYKNGRFSAKIPWVKGKRELIKNNYNWERLRVERMVRTLKKQPEKYQMYVDKINAEVEKGYLEAIEDLTPDKGDVYYLMHLPVWRPDKVSTPCRIVVNASLQDHSGNSLNKAIHKGPDLTNRLLTVGMRFRKGETAFITDVKEFFPQIKLFQEDKDMFRFLWIDPNGKVKIFRYCRLMFGLNCSPFLAQFVCLMGAKLNKHTHPKAYDTLLHSRYVDDVDDSGKEEDCVKAVKETQEVLKKTGVKIHKTLSNSDAVMLAVDQDARLKQWSENEPKPTAFVLGIFWDPNKDILKISTANIPTTRIKTKRGFLKVLAGQFDPFGFICAFMVIAKLILQKMWSRGISWDEALPEDLEEECNEWADQLKELEQLEIPRHVVNGVVTSIHGFCDSSDIAMNATIYVATADGKVGLVMAKSRVHSLKPRSIQQKELQSAVLLSQLITEVKRVYPGVKTTLWTDSTTTLAWIMVDDPRKHIVFVHTRVGIIRENTKVEEWRHVDSANNSADPGSRGLSLKQLMECELFWFGPRFLRDDSIPWPPEKKYFKTDVDVKKKYQVEEVFVNFTKLEHVPSPDQFETFEDMKMQTARNNKEKEQQDGPITVQDLTKAEMDIIHTCQVESFSEEMQALEAGNQVLAKSKLAQAKPFLDDQKVMRSDSRLQDAELLDQETKNPIILPKNKKVTVLIIKEAHEKSNHAYALNWTVDEVKKRFYIPSCRQQVKKFLRHCKPCKMNFGRPRPAVMAPLPSVRVSNPMKTFFHVGVDYAGPFFTLKGRGQARNKRWLCLFTCLVTRAVHLELAYGMNTDNFLMALNNFVARRGKVELIWSDRGTNFRGAQREIRELLQQLSEDELQEHLATKGIKFKFNTAYSPHQGGVWESMVKSCKRAIFCVLKKQDFTDELLIAAFTQAENVVNSRPLGYQSNDPNDHRVVTPNMFIHGRLEGYQMPASVDNTDFNPRQRWRLVQQAVKHIWRRFLREIIPNLGIRQKWTRDQRNFEEGDEVLVIEPNVPRYKWTIGRVTRTYPGRDNVVRIVDVRTEDGDILNKTVHRLIPLT